MYRGYFRIEKKLIRTKNSFVFFAASFWSDSDASQNFLKLKHFSFNVRSAESISSDYP